MARGSGRGGFAAEYMMTVLDDLEERHGGATGLLARQGIREVDLQELHELLTEQVG